MDFCYVLTKLLDDGDTADNGQGLHLALSNVNDAEDHENQGSKMFGLVFASINILFVPIAVIIAFWLNANGVLPAASPTIHRIPM